MTDGGVRILVVDDNEDNRYTLARRLRREGWTNLTIAENGREALDRITKERFDLILLDIMMPEVNGYEVLERLKADPGTRDIPVLMISALSDIESVVRCIELGADDYLLKPFNPVLLRARINACLEKKRLHDQELSYLAEIERQRCRVIRGTGAQAHVGFQVPRGGHLRGAAHHWLLTAVDALRPSGGAGGVQHLGTAHRVVDVVAGVRRDRVFVIGETFHRPVDDQSEPCARRIAQ